MKSDKSAIYRAFKLSYSDKSAVVIHNPCWIAACKLKQGTYPDRVFLIGDTEQKMGDSGYGHIRFIHGHLRLAGPLISSSMFGDIHQFVHRHGYTFLISLSPGCLVTVVAGGGAPASAPRDTPHEILHPLRMGQSASVRTYSLHIWTVNESSFCGFSGLGSSPRRHLPKHPHLHPPQRGDWRTCSQEHLVYWSWRGYGDARSFLGHGIASGEDFLVHLTDRTRACTRIVPQKLKESG